VKVKKLSALMYFSSYVTGESCDIEI